MKEQINNFARSLYAVIRGLKYTLVNPWVWKYVFAAIFLNILSFILVIVLTLILLNYSLEGIGKIVGFEVTTDLKYVGQFLFITVGLFFALISFNSISTIINAPIYNRLRERVWADKLIMNSYKYQPHFAKEVSYAFSNEIREFVVIIVMFILSSIINLIPFIGQILFVGFNYLQLILNTGLDLFDPVFAKKDMNLTERMEFLMSHPTRYWPFLLIAGFIASIPVINLIAIPILNVSAMLLYEE